MRILFLAPQPFYEERGTPIAVDRALRVLSQRGDPIDLVTYPEGQPASYPNVTLHRAPDLPFTRGVRPGFSWKKIVNDLLMCLVVARLLLRKRYTLAHAVEESVFIALLLKWLFRIPYVYDMDSSLSQQIGEKYTAAARLASVLGAFERLAVRHAQAVVPVCDALAGLIAPYQPRRVVILRDVSLLQSVPPGQVEDIRTTFNIGGTLTLYVGNLETYQGIDLLLESFAIVAGQIRDAALVIIGGVAADIARYAEQCLALGLKINRQVYFCGTRPVEHLGAYLAQADILVSPRIKGANTPMKLYSYLDSGKAVLATDLPTHTQVLNERVAMLAAPEPQAFARALLGLIGDAALREQLGAAGHQLIEDEYSYDAFQARLTTLYDDLSAEITRHDAHGPAGVTYPPDQAKGRWAER